MSKRFEKIRKKYIGTFAEKQKNIQTAWDNKDVSQVNELMHKLAGSSGAYGLDDLYTHVKDCMELTVNKNSYNSEKVEKSIQHIISILNNNYQLTQ